MKKTPTKKASRSDSGYQWNLKLLYSSPNDPQIEKDVLALEKAYADFAKKYEDDRDYTKDAHKLLRSLKDWDELCRIADMWKPTRYFQKLNDIDGSNSVAQASLARIRSRLQISANKILFYKISLGKIASALQKTFLQNPDLKEYKRFLEVTFKGARYDLSEAEEKISNLKSLPSYSLWVQGQEKLLNSQMVTFKGKEMPISKAVGMYPELPVKDSRFLLDAVNQKMKDISGFAEVEMNAIMIDKKIEDGLRGFGKPYESTFLAYQNEEKSILSLIDAVNKSSSISRRFFKLQAKLLKLKRLEYADSMAKIGRISKRFTLAEGVAMLKEALDEYDPRYARIFSDMVDNGQIDFFPRKGKRGGAYCSSASDQSTFILTNYNDNADSLMTLAHEMGHAFHAYFSRGQKPIYEHAPISTCEVASTFFENIMFEQIYSSLNDTEKVILLHDRIRDDITTIFVQIACFNYELALHTRVRKEGYLSANEIALEWNKSIAPFFGSIFRLKELDGYRFVRWPHLRYYFYTYSYAFGQLISTAMYKRYRQDRNFLKSVEKFLSAGSSKSPKDIFQDIGINISKPDFWMEGLKEIEDDIARLEKLTKK